MSSSILILSSCRLVDRMSRSYHNIIPINFFQRLLSIYTCGTTLWDKCALVFDGGKISSSRLGSTIVNLSIPGEFSIQRKGDECDTVLEKLYKYGLTNSSISSK
jgi:hypothetical protein